MDALRRLVRALRLYSRVCEGRLGLSAAQVFALRALESAGPLSLGGLAAATLTDPSSVSVVVGRLARKGLVARRRAASDGRRAELSLTPRGRSLLRGVPASPQERVVRALAALPARRRAALARDLQSVLRGAGLFQAPATLFFEDKT